MIFKKKKFCANCGSEMNVNATFCSNCGTHELKATNQVGNNLVATFNPGTAFLISIYTTGAGHIYLGLFKRGISFLISHSSCSISSYIYTTIGISMVYVSCDCIIIRYFSMFNFAYIFNL